MNSAKGYSASDAVTDAPTTALGSMIERTKRLNDSLMTQGSRLESLLDRLAGPVGPQEAKLKPAAVPFGAVGHLTASLDGYEQQLDRLADAVGRLENIA